MGGRDRASRCRASETLKVFETGAVSRGEVSRSRRAIVRTRHQAHRAALHSDYTTEPLRALAALVNLDQSPMFESLESESSFVIHAFLYKYIYRPFKSARRY